MRWESQAPPQPLPLGPKGVFPAPSTSYSPPRPTSTRGQVPPSPQHSFLTRDHRARVFPDWHLLRGCEEGRTGSALRDLRLRESSFFLPSWDLQGLGLSTRRRRKE